jgi:hypothetical protein
MQQTELTRILPSRALGDTLDCYRGFMLPRAWQG